MSCFRLKVVPFDLRRGSREVNGNVEGGTASGRKITV